MSGLMLKFFFTFILGAILMLVLSFTIYRKSYYYKKSVADVDKSVKKPGILSRLITVMILISMISFFTIFNLWVLSGESYSYIFLIFLNLALVALLSLFDALFIDFFLLVIWRPPLLRLPEGLPTRDSMLRHVKLQFTFGWIFKVPIAIFAATFARLFNTGVF